jgi:hypothetical protein
MQKTNANGNPIQKNKQRKPVKSTNKYRNKELAKAGYIMQEE